MKVYQPAIDDWKLALAWRRMMVAQDIKSYPPCLLSLHTFLATMQPSTIVVYEEDASEPWFLLWAERTTWDFAIVSTWIREEKRHTKAALHAVKLALHHVFGQTAALLAYTTHEWHAAQLTKLGFRRTATLPGVACGEDAYQLVLTRDQFALQPVEGAA